MSDQLSIFEQKKISSDHIPLAERCRPQTLEDIIGQDKLLANDSLLKRMLASGKLSSFILWGPPGSGKTTIARLVSLMQNYNFIPFSAVLTGIKEVKQVMKEAENSLFYSEIPTVIFIDEIHRFNKAQQDAFLPYLEKGAIILIGATTENPSFEIIPALLSRCHVLVLEQLKDEHIRTIIEKALAKYNPEKIEFSQQVIDFLVSQSGGDARKALNNLEVILIHHQSNQALTVELMKKILAGKTLLYDKNREEHFNHISALHKALRASDPQAGLYWLARMLEAGEDPLYIVRRLVRFASEDVGLADPNALLQAIAVKEAVHFIGMPEGSNAIAQLVVYLATAPKSNSLYTAYGAAVADAHKTGHLPVPLQIRNAPTELLKELEYGKDYKYAHDFDHHYAYMKCFPEAMREKTYYLPTDFGFEKEIKNRLDWWAKLKEKQNEHKDK
jgi:putative ATPase